MIVFERTLQTFLQEFCQFQCSKHKRLQTICNYLVFFKEKVTQNFNSITNGNYIQYLFLTPIQQYLPPPQHSVSSGKNLVKRESSIEVVYPSPTTRVKMARSCLLRNYLIKHCVFLNKLKQFKRRTILLDNPHCEKVFSRQHACNRCVIQLREKKENKTQQPKFVVTAGQKADGDYHLT